MARLMRKKAYIDRGEKPPPDDEGEFNWTLPQNYQINSRPMPTKRPNFSTRLVCMCRMCVAS